MRNEPCSEEEKQRERLTPQPYLVPSLAEKAGLSSRLKSGMANKEDERFKITHGVYWLGVARYEFWYWSSQESIPEEVMWGAGMGVTRRGDG